jgi:hypothetical protein
MLTVMKNHLAGKSGNLIDLLAHLSDEELVQQETYYADEQAKMDAKGSTFGSFKFGNMRAAVDREQKFRRTQRSTPVE